MSIALLIKGLQKNYEEILPTEMEIKDTQVLAKVSYEIL